MSANATTRRMLATPKLVSPQARESFFRMSELRRLIIYRAAVDKAITKNARHLALGWI